MIAFTWEWTRQFVVLSLAEWLSHTVSPWMRQSRPWPIGGLLALAITAGVTAYAIVWLSAWLGAGWVVGGLCVLMGGVWWRVRR